MENNSFKLFPVAAGAKAPPLVSNWPVIATDDPEQIERWRVQFPGCNWGIHCAGMIVLDIDVKKGGNESLQLLELTHGLPQTYTVETPTGGRHVYYRADGDVPNGVDVLGRGVDIRSGGGYVVGPGSTIGAAGYRVAVDSPVAEAPDWLAARLGHAPVKKGPATDVADASETTVERAAGWLRTAERSVKGQGGDQTAYRVACALRDQGISYQQACELMRSEAWDYGCGWRDGWLEAKPIRSAYRYAQNEPGAKSVTAGAFVAMPAPKAAPRSTRVQLAVDMATESATDDYVIKHWLSAASYVDFFGAPSEGKTFNALDMAYHVATGKPWMGNRVRGGVVLYLAFEGKGGMRKRIKALAHRDKDLGRLYLAGASMNLRDVAGRQEIGAILAELPEKPKLIVIDTFARALMGGDENSAQDVGAFNNAIEALIESTGACVMIIHHSGKNKSAGARGSSALLGAIDTEIEVDNKQIISRKQREGENPLPIGFLLKPVPIGMDSDGELMTSCVVEQSQVVAHGRRPLTGKAEHAFNILNELTGPENNPVSKARWIAKMTDEGLGRSSAYNWPRKLEMLQLVMIEDDFVRRRLA